MQSVPVCTFPPFHSSALLSSPGKAISSRALISYHSWDGKHIENTSAEHPSQRHILCAQIQTGPVQEHRSAQFYTALTSSLLLLLLLCEFHLQVFVMNTSWWALLSILMLRWIPPFCPARLAERASCFLSNKTANKDMLDLFSCIHLREHKPTCWFTQTQPQAGQRVSFP